ncbi:MAG: hypothetical protein NWF04_03705 [Candidatus Bathyarchaeota archaeon]|nr:hypothetical protein [Candidatus Bathyarchaeota archaeon]
MADTLTLLIGALIGIVSGIVSYIVNHLLSIREKKVIRDFEVREKGREFFHLTYGAIATLSDMVKPFCDNKKATEGTILTENGYVSLPKAEIIKRYKTAYAKYSLLWYNSREKGLEIFWTNKFIEILSFFWGYASYFNEKEENWANYDAMIKFREYSAQYVVAMDKLMGLHDDRKVPKC